MPDTVKITGINLSDTTKIWANGDRPLAWFDCEVRGFRLAGCVLIRTSRGFLLAQAPRGDSGKEGVRAIQIADPAVREAMADAAYGAFTALGGKEAA